MTQNWDEPPELSNWNGKFYKQEGNPDDVRDEEYEAEYLEELNQERRQDEESNNHCDGEVI